MTSNHPKAVIFDLDGTLVDSAADVGDAVNRVLTASGHPVHPTASYYRFLGDGVFELMRRALPDGVRSTEMIRAGVTAFFQEYEENWHRKTRLYPGISELLDELSQRGVTLGVLSNKPHRFTRAFAAAFLSKWTFAAVFGQRDDVPRKPDPEAALEIAEQFGLSPVDIVFVGDTPTDMKTAVAAGMLPVGAAWGFRPSRELTKSGANMVIAHPLDLLQVFDRPSALIV